MWRGGRDNDDDDIDEVASMDGSESISSSRGSNVKISKASEDGETEEDEQNAYDDAEFDGYSDEFDSDGDEDEKAPEAQDIAPPSSQNATTNRWSVGDKVQVFWEDEQEWFDGTVSRVEHTRCFIDYIDGEQQWESPSIIRVGPPGQPDEVKQLQLMSSNEVSGLVGRRVSVYWTEEASWFNGTIRALDPAESPVRVSVLYDDGDEQWVSQHAFKDVLVLPALNVRSQPLPISSTTERKHDGGSSVPARNEKVLVARKYTPALENHFEPVRVARPYKCAVENHIGTIVAPRHRDIAASTDDINQSYTVDMQCNTVTQDCQIQTEINTSVSSA